MYIYDCLKFWNRQDHVNGSNKEDTPTELMFGF